MNASLHLTKLVGPGAVLALAVLAAGCGSIRSQSSETRGGLRLRQITTAEEEQSLKPSDSVAMVCTKCKTVLFANVDKPRTRFFAPLERRHYCPGCKSTITTTGAGFNVKQEVRHMCGACGDDSVFCCATAGSNPTEGMQKK